MHLRTPHLIGTSALLALLTSSAIAGESDTPIANDKNPISTAPAAPTPTDFEHSDSVSQYLLGPNIWDSTYDAIEQWKKDNHIPITIGGNSWWHIDRNEHIYGDGYGVPHERGTYYYFVDADPSYKFEPGAFVQEIGIHAEWRARDSDDHIRAFYLTNEWFYNAYAYAKTAWGDFKAGLITTDIGIPWDGTWWEGVPYFDGYKFDPAWGVTWQKPWKVNDTFHIDTDAQFYFIDGGINGSEPGADVLSVPGARERNTGVLRVVPTWELAKDTTLAVGASGLVGGITGGSAYGLSSTREAWDAEATLTVKNWSIFGEVLRGYGVVNPANYVSGGPSDRVSSARGGIAYKYGPITWHVNYSYGWDQNPSGHQFVFDPGATIQLTKNITFYAEYVKWNVTNAQGVSSKYDDGFELILVWKL